MLQDRYPCYLANRPVFTGRELKVTDKYRGAVATRVALADEATIEAAIAAAVAAEGPMRKLPPWKRQAVLEHCVARFRERAEELAVALCIEAGKPIKDSRGEVTRLIDTFKIAAEEAVRGEGEIMDLGRTPRTENYLAFTKRVPVGACSLISPFNFPLNLVAHKIAPAIAAGCPFVLKPASNTPVGALIIGEILAETDLPEGAFSVLPCPREGARLFCEDERLKLLTFTGSPEVGWDLKARAGKKKVVLELGGNAACVVDADADLDFAIPRIVFGAFYQSGQSCIGVQRIFVHRDRLDEFRSRFVAAASALKSGDPRSEDTFLGPLIHESEAIRLQGWIQSAVDRGAKLLCGGARQGAILEATVLENVPPDEPICAKEAFGPVAVLEAFDDFDQVLDRVNASRYGLQAGLFVKDLQKALKAWDRLEVGGVVLNDVPSWRADAMPYGGVKDSGFGREGVRWAIEDMTELRLMVIRQG
jgi:acyl-CoA reductase-like NAD-dependent aldehyde dehydrogenase